MPEHAGSADAAVEIAVVGGGLIGAVAALGIAVQGRRVALVEQAAPAIAPGRFGHDLRNIAAAPATRRLLEDVGVWSRLVPVPYRAMRVWDARGTGTLVFDAAELDREALGWMLENGPTQVAVWDALRTHPNVVLRVGEPVTEVRAAADRVTLELGAARLDAALLIGADGARSRVRAALGVAADTQETGHAALATVVRTSAPHAGVAYQCFLEDGPLALLPGPEPDLASVVWSQPPAAAARRQALPEPAFCAEVARCMDACLGTIRASDERVVFPLQQMLAASFHPHPRVLLIGDAAHVLHPLAGLGANLGFEDVRALLEVLARLPLAADSAAPGIWRAFARRRRTRAALMVQVMAGLQRLYAATGPLGQLLRNTGVDWFNRSGPLKRQIMAEAMGLGALH